MHPQLYSSFPLQALLLCAACALLALWAVLGFVLSEVVGAAQCVGLHSLPGDFHFSIANNGN